MQPPQFDYQRPTALAEALRLLDSAGGARPIAGGHSLLPLMKLRQAHPTMLVDLRHVEGLDGIRRTDGSIMIGAMTTHGEIVTSDVIREGCGVLAEAASMIGDAQVRNMGTIGGNVAHADPAADFPTVLTALDATIHVAGSGGERSIAADDFFVDLFTTSLGSGEIVVGVEVPVLVSGRTGSYQKHRHPASSYAVVGVAAIVTLAGGVCADTTIVVGGVTGTPVKCTAAGATLDGREPAEAAFAEAAGDVAAALEEPIGDVYASGEYRTHLATVLTRRALAAATR